MTSHVDLLVSARDEEFLASLVRMAADERLPADRVAMNSRVSYREEPGGARRSIALVHPNESSPAEGRISVLSPVGRALLGRRAGSVASIGIPGGRALTLRVLEIERPRAAEESS